MTIKPVILDIRKKSHNQKLEVIINAKAPIIIDKYKDQIEELFKIQNPKDKNNQSKKQKFADKYVAKNPGNWIYFPWSNTLNHLLYEDDFYEVRTARNKPLIPIDLQQKFRQMTIGVVGLSVGNSVALSIIYSGGADKIKLADPDTLELSNLNRIRASVNNLGEKKTHITAKQIYEINPYAQITLYNQGINPTNIKDFFLSDPKLDLVIDECDDLNLKKYLRLISNNLHTPLLMASDNGFESNIDLQITTPSKSVSLDQIINDFKNTKKISLSEKDQVKFIAKLIGAENFSEGMQDATYEKLAARIASWPQLAMTVFLGGSLSAYTTLLLSQNKNQNIHKTFSFPELLNQPWNSINNQKKRSRKTKKFIEFITNL